MLITCDKCGEVFDDQYYGCCPFCNEVKERDES